MMIQATEIWTTQRSDFRVRPKRRGLQWSIREVAKLVEMVWGGRERQSQLMQPLVEIGGLDNNVGLMWDWGGRCY